MALESYRRKRDFKVTKEPSGKAPKATHGDSFVIQKHNARRLHYDFRLELDGVLKSWAVTRGPSLVPGEKRLAVHVEDHPLEYGGFEGTIPKGEYGGGTVIVWDRGRWAPVGDPHYGYAKGHLDFDLHGEKLGGRWHLVRMANRKREKQDNWLLIKADDDQARTASDPDILQERPLSVQTGREVADVAGEAPGWSSKTGKIDPAPAAAPPHRTRTSRRKAAATTPRETAAPSALPDFIAPALASLVDRPPTGKRWLHEIKFDGYRIQAQLSDGQLRLLTRSGLDWTKRFGTAIHRALTALPAKTAVIDGELVVENDSGASDFAALQADLSDGRQDRFVFYAFDLLYLDGNDLRAATLTHRKSMLEPLLAGAPPVLRLSASFDQDGDMILRHACRLSLEGVVSKLRDAPYRSGRGRDWVKSKCAHRQEFVVCGYVPATATPRAIGSLVLGYYVDSKLTPAGRVGTGYTAAVAKSLFATLEKIPVKTSPFAAKLPPGAARDVRFVKPQLVAEVEFAGWTAEGSTRHAAFRGLREDKHATDITRESDAAPDTPKPKQPIKLSHPDRIYWPEDGVTKQRLAEYYSEIWRHIAPFITNRPLALVRCPGGIASPCFFQKHAWQGASRHIREVPDPQHKTDETLLVIDSLDGLISLVQAGVLEIHPWGAMLATLEQPDMIIMDLDPGPDVAWSRVIDAAREVRQRLSHHGLTSFVKTSGGKGLHVVAPIEPRADWVRTKAFTKSIAEAMAHSSPDAYVATITKSKRAGKILIDYLRNGRGNTAVAPYSTRARPGAAVSMPLDWAELGELAGPAHFTVMNAPAWLEQRAGDPWAAFWASAAGIPVR